MHFFQVCSMHDKRLNCESLMAQRCSCVSTQIFWRCDSLWWKKHGKWILVFAIFRCSTTWTRRSNRILLELRKGWKDLNTCGNNVSLKTVWYRSMIKFMMFHAMQCRRGTLKQYFERDVEMRFYHWSWVYEWVLQFYVSLAFLDQCQLERRAI